MIDRILLWLVSDKIFIKKLVTILKDLTKFQFKILGKTLVKIFVKFPQSFRFIFEIFLETSSQQKIDYRKFTAR